MPASSGKETRPTLLGGNQYRLFQRYEKRKFAGYKILRPYIAHAASLRLAEVSPA
jgi:hypothetical protein